MVMRVSWKGGPILAQEFLVPEWGFPLLGFLGVCLLLLIVLSPIALVRGQRARAAAVAKGIHIQGVKASAVFKSGVASEILCREIRSIVESQRRFSRVEEVPRGMDVYARANVWAWGEVIEVRFAETREGTEIHATCRPRLSTTLYDYGQSSSDLSLFLDQLLERTEAIQRGDGGH